MSEDSHHEVTRRRTQSLNVVRFGVRNSKDLSIWRRLNPLNNRLTKLKVEKAQEKYRREVEAETRQIRFDNRGNSNDMIIPHALFRMHLKKADEFAEQQYSIFRDVWLRLGGVESAAFIRTISWMVIQRPFDARGSSFARQEKRRFSRSVGLSPVLSQETIRKGFDHRKTEWRDKLEIMALEWEAVAQSRALAAKLRDSQVNTSREAKPVSGLAASETVRQAVRGKRPTRPKPLCFESALKQLRENPGLPLVDLCRLMDRKAEQYPTSQKYLPPERWKVRSFMEQYKKRSNTVSRFLSDVRKAANSAGD